MALTLNMLFEKLDGQWSVPSPLLASERFSWMVTLTHDVDTMTSASVEFLGRMEEVEGVLHCGSLESAIRCKKAHPNLNVMAVCVSDEEWDRACELHSESLILYRSGTTLDSAFQTISMFFLVYNSWTDTMQKTLLGGGSYQELLDNSRSILPGLVSITDSAFRLVGYIGEVADDNETMKFLIQNGFHSKKTVENFRKIGALKTWMTQMEVLRIPPTVVVSEPTLSYVIRMHGSYFIHVVLQLPEEQMTEGVFDAFGIFLDFIQDSADNQWKIEQSYSQPYARDLVGLLEAPAERKVDHVVRLVRAGLLKEANYLLMLFDFGGSQDDVEARIGYYAWRLLDYVPQGKVAIIENKLVLLAECDSHVRETIMLMSQVASFQHFGRCDVGVSYPFESLEHASFAYRQARRTLAYASRDLNSEHEPFAVETNEESNTRIYWFRDFFAAFVFEIDDPDPALMRHCVQSSIPMKMLKADEEKGSNDLRLLYEYIRQERNAVKTAEVFFMHRNTLAYKVERIAEQVGLDLDDYIARRNFILECNLLQSYQNAIAK